MGASKSKTAAASAEAGGPPSPAVLSAPKVKPSGAGGGAGGRPPKPVDSVSQASFVSGGVDQYFGALRPKAKLTGLAATLPMLVPGDGYTDGGGDPRLVVLQGNALTLDYKIMVQAPQTARPQLQAAIDQIFAEIDDVFNNWNPSSEVSRLNSAPAGVPVPLSAPLARLLHQCIHLHAVTEGRFDLTMGPLKKLWSARLRQGARPSVQEATAAAALVGMGKVALQPDGRASKASAGVSLDLCAIAKGLGVDMLVERVRREGYPDVYVDWAGDIRAAGRHPAGRDWRTAVACPPPLVSLFDAWKGTAENAGDRRMLADVPLADCAAATSGDYYQIYKFGYFHIFDPRRGAPCKATAKSIASATVVASTCALADALATAAMVCDSDAAARDFLEKASARLPGQVHGYVLYSRASPAVIQSASFAAGAGPVSLPRAPAVPADRLRDLMRLIPLPVAVVAAPPSQAAGGVPYGITANSVAACSAEPPLLSFNVMRGSAMHAVLSEQRRGPLPLAVHLLGPDQEAVAALFSGPNQTGARSQFDGLRCQTDPATGVPIIPGCFAVLRCAVEQVVTAGDHALVLARVTACDAAQGGPSAFPAVWHARACRAPSPLEGSVPPLSPGAPFAEVAARLPRPAAEVHAAGGREFADGLTLLSPDPPLLSLSLRTARPAAAACREPGAEFWVRLSSRTGPVADVLCRTLAAHAAGDSALLVLEPRALQLEAPPASPPALLFFDAGARRDAPPAYCVLP